MGNTLAFKILIGGLRSYTDNFRFFFRISLPWLILCLPVYWVVRDYLLVHPLHDNGVNLNVRSMMIEMLLPLILSIAFASIAVSWHRHILSRARTPLLVFDSAVRRYWWNGVAIALIAAVVAIPVVLIVLALNAVLGAAANTVTLIAVYVIIILIVYRLSIKLPALAIGRLSYGFKNSWNDTKGQTWQFLILGTVLAFIGKLVASIEQLAENRLPLMDSFLVHYALISVEPVIELVFAGLGVSILTYTYAYFAENKEL